MAINLGFYTPEGNLARRSHGYGEVTYQLLEAGKRLGYNFYYIGRNLKTRLHLGQPNLCHHAMDPSKHNISYTAWESTEPHSGWLRAMRDADEVWATSTWCKEVYESWGIKVSKVFPHGIDPAWHPMKKKRGDKIEFLCVGAETPRKGAQQTYDAFRRAFGDRNDVHLYIKTRDSLRVANEQGVRDANLLGKNVTVLPGDYPMSKLISLYQKADIVTYLSVGEGFGFFPLQALATGTPVLCPSEWAEYRDFLGELSLSSTYQDSPYPDIHPGKMLKLDTDEVVDKMRYAVDNIEALHARFFKQSFAVHKEYDWDKLAGRGLAGLTNN